MRTAVIVHGMPYRSMYFDPRTASPSNYHWIPWLQKQLAMRDVVAQAPEMPTPYAPKYEEWCAVLERHPVDENTTLIGWSAGGGFLLRWLCDSPDVRIRKLILVAPWLNLEREVNPEREGTGPFFDFQLSDRLSVYDVVMFSSDNDDDIIKASVHRILDVIPGTRHRIFHYGHFGHWDMPKPEFPELLDEVLA